MTTAKDFARGVKARETLRGKLLKAAAGTRTGAIVAAMFGQAIAAPCFHGQASLTSDGFLMCDFSDSDGRRHMGAFVGAVSDLGGNLRRLADHCQLEPSEREIFEEAAQQWIATRYSNPGKLLN